ncbi:MAG: sensor histidine kinase, partial [Rufibacter sp.]
AQNYLHKISGYSQQMMDKMDDIVWSINPLNDTMLSLTARMRAFAVEILEPKGIDFELEVEKPALSLPVPLAIRHDVYLIFKEALNNAAKYSEARKVTVMLDEAHGALQMVIQDNGIGFTPTSASGGNGLLNMERRAQTLGGHLQIESAPEKGTCITLVVPLAKTKRFSTAPHHDQVTPL